MSKFFQKAMIWNISLGKLKELYETGFPLTLLGLARWTLVDLHLAESEWLKVRGLQRR